MNLYESIIKEAPKGSSLGEMYPYHTHLKDVYGDLLKLSDVTIEKWFTISTGEPVYYITGYYQPKRKLNIEGLSYSDEKDYFDEGYVMYNVEHKYYEQFTPEEIFYYADDNEDAIKPIKKDMDKIMNKIVRENSSVFKYGEE